MLKKLSILFILSACGLLAFKAALLIPIALFGQASLLIFLGYNLASVIFRHITASRW